MYKVFLNVYFNNSDLLGTTCNVNSNNKTLLLTCLPLLLV